MVKSVWFYTFPCSQAHNLTIKRSTTLFESFGRILDKGINRLIGVGDGQGGEEGASRSQSEGWAPSDAASAYRRTTSQASFDSMRNTADEGRQVSNQDGQKTHCLYLKEQTFVVAYFTDNFT